MTAACIACGSATARRTLVDFGRVPRSGTFLSDSKREVKTWPLRFEYCAACGLVGQRELYPEVGDYTEVGRGTARQLPEYTAEILRAIEGAGVRKSDLVVEVGCNDGTFMDQLAAFGFERILGVEPSRPLATICADKGHRVEAVHLTAATAEQMRVAQSPAAAVVCRHTLEHVPQPLDFLKAARALLCDDGLLFIEVPATLPIVEGLLAHELWDEHLTYFSPANLSALLNAAGFQPLEVVERPHRGSSNLLAWARRSAGGGRLPDYRGDIHRLVRASDRFQERWTTYLAALEEKAAKWSGPIYALGASHLQSNFLNFTGLGGKVDTLVDDDPAKIGRMVPLPQPTPVVSTESFIRQCRAGVVILTAFGYAKWTDVVRDSMRGRHVTVFDPLDEIDSKAGKS